MMADFKLNYVIDFLQSRGWQEERVGRNFVTYKPSLELELPEDFRIELPVNDSNSGSMQLYLGGILDLLKQLYPLFKQEDFNILLSNTDTIFSTRIMDADTKEGTIQLNKLSKIYDLQKKMLKQAVTFLVTRQNIFGSAKTQADLFIDNSRSLPTSKGSFITKLQLPDINHTKTNTPSGDKVIERVFQSIDFIQEEILKTPLVAIDKNYVRSNEKDLNIELLSAINNFYKSGQVDHVNFSFHNNRSDGYLDTSGILERSNYLTAFIRQSKKVIIEETVVRFYGLITKLNSIDPTSDKGNTISIDIDNAEEVKKVKVVLTSKAYKLAVEAHSQKKPVIVEGIAKLSGNQYIINDPETFELLES
jgi:hypothetical protein